MSPYLELILLFVAAAVSWSRFASIFSTDTETEKLLSPLTTLATTVFLGSVGLMFYEADTVMALLRR